LLALIEFVSAFLRAQIAEEGSAAAALAGQTFITFLFGKAGCEKCRLAQMGARVCK
jgi:hypothetical protein